MNASHPRAGSAPGLGDPFTAGRVAGLLALLVFVAFPQVALGLQSFVIRDFGFFAYPSAYFQRESFWRGELPLWNPWNACGVPFLAQWNTMPLYPPVLLYLLLPLTWGLNFFCLLHLWWGGLGAFFLTRGWSGHGGAAAFAGVAFAFNGMTLNLLMWPSHIATFAWMPWVVLCVERAWREGGGRVLLAAVVGALQMLAGGPETVLFTWLLLTALWAGDLVRNWKRGGDASAAAGPNAAECAGAPLSVAARFVGVAVLVFLLAAAQLLPFLELAAHSERELGFADTRWSMPARGLANFLVPMAFGHVSNLGIFVQHGQGWTSSYYPGMSVLLLALLAVVALRAGKDAVPTPQPAPAAGWRAGVLGIATLAAVVLAMGDQTVFYRALRGVVPQLSLMTYPVKFLLVVSFALPLLAGLVLARLLPEHAAARNPDAPPARSQPAPGWTRWIDRCALVLLGLIGVVAVWAWRAPAPEEQVRLTWFNALSRAAFLIATATLLLALARGAARPALRRLAPWALMFLVWLDTLTHQPSQQPTAAPWVYEPGLARVKLTLQPQPALGESRAMVAPDSVRRFREIVLASPADNFVVKRLGLFADCNLLDGVPKVDGFFSLYPRHSGELISALYGATNAAPAGLLDFLGVSQQTAPGEDVRWRPRATFLPWITGGQQPVFLDDAAALGALFQADFDPRRFVLLPPEAAARMNVRASSRVQLRPQRFEAQRVEFEVETDAPALVVVAQTWYPRWRARVDGRPTPLLRANYAFQALEVPAGAHRVQLRYEDGPFQIGAVLSALAWIGCAAGLVWRRRAVSEATIL